VNTEQSVVHKLDQLVLGTLLSFPVLLNLRVYLLQTQVFRVRQVNEPCIGLTQENSIENSCYELELKGLSNRTTLVLSNTRELNRVPSTE